MGDILDKCKVEVVVMLQAGQAGEIHYVKGIKGEKCEEGPVSLSIIPICCRCYPWWSPRCAAKGEWPHWEAWQHQPESQPCACSCPPLGTMIGWQPCRHRCHHYSSQWSDGLLSLRPGVA
jgi:hypothetical protein